MKDLDITNVEKELVLPDGSRVLLVGAMGVGAHIADDLVSRNVFRVDKSGRILWRIGLPQNVYPRSPITNIYLDADGRLMACSYDGVEHVVDVESGRAEARRFLK